MNLVFTLVALALDWIASKTGLSYNEINIVAYYIALPLVYVALIDRILHRHLLKIIFSLSWVLILFSIKDFSAFSDTLFKWSVDFLMLFSVVGLNYVAASVVICVILPGIVFLILLLLAFPSLRQKITKLHEKR